jgi:hypothetical protein
MGISLPNVASRETQSLRPGYAQSLARRVSVFFDRSVASARRGLVERGQANESTLNFMAAVVTGIQPRDQQEAMLAAQMAAVHTAAMKQAALLATATELRQLDSFERALNKLARTFLSQLDALKRYRSSGAQKVTVQKVSVEQGGQAIVGNVTHVQRAATEDEKVLDLTAEPTESVQPAGPAATDRRAPPLTISEEMVVPQEEER